jgi:mono/diheme cytochrome c family protein
MRSFVGWAAALAVGLSLSLRAASAREGADSPPAAAAAAPEADRLFRRYCATCHGQDFKGTDLRAVNPEIPDFTSAAWHANHSDARLLVSILSGRGAGMPAFADKLSQEQARSLVARLRQAAPIGAKPPSPAMDDFHRRFEELTRELDALRDEFYEADRADQP